MKTDGPISRKTQHIKATRVIMTIESLSGFTTISTVVFEYSIVVRGHWRSRKLLIHNTS